MTGITVLWLESGRSNETDQLQVDETSAPDTQSERADLQTGQEIQDDRKKDKTDGALVLSSLTSGLFFWKIFYISCFLVL